MMEAAGFDGRRASTATTPGIERIVWGRAA